MEGSTACRFSVPLKSDVTKKKLWKDNMTPSSTIICEAERYSKVF